MPAIEARFLFVPELSAIAWAMPFEEHMGGFLGARKCLTKDSNGYSPVPCCLEKPAGSAHDESGSGRWYGSKISRALIQPALHL